MSSNLKHIGGVAIILAIPLIIGLLDPDIVNKESLCPVMRFYHIPCPGCGLTKSFILLYRGDLATSIYFHPFGIIIVCVLCLLLLLAVIDWIGNNNLFDKVIELTTFWQFLTILFAIQYIIRIISLTPLSPSRL